MQKCPIKDKALYLLARREHSRQELQRKLLQRGFVLPAIQKVLDSLEHDNLLNEVRFVECFIRSRHFQGIGPLKICAELQNRGIDRSLILANEAWQEIVWQASAIAVRIKRFGQSLPKDTQGMRQQARFLEQRGFTAEQIRIALKGQPD